MVRIFLAVAALGLVASSAAAAPFAFLTTYNYETSASILAAAGSIHTTGTGTGGGLCAIGSGGCNSLITGPLTGGTSSAGSIALPTTPGVAGDNYLLTITLSYVTGDPVGDIWDVTLNGANVGTTSVVGIVNGAGHSSGTLHANVHGGSTNTISVTDLLEQYLGQTDNLPGVLGVTADNGGTVTASGTYNQSLFTLRVSATPNPEPASIGLFVGGLAALGVIRRRRGRH
jgi:hypothetical protein